MCGRILVPRIMGCHDHEGLAEGDRELTMAPHVERALVAQDLKRSESYRRNPPKRGELHEEGRRKGILKNSFTSNEITTETVDSVHHKREADGATTPKKRQCCLEKEKIDESILLENKERKRSLSAKKEKGRAEVGASGTER